MSVQPVPRAVLEARQAAVDPDTFRAAFRQHPAGVAVITVWGPQGPAGFTATSLASASLDPPLLTFVVSDTASSWVALSTATHLVVNLLDADARDVADRFATSGINRFAPPTRWRRLDTGEPRLEDVNGWLRGRIHERVPVGDHHLVVAEVVEAETYAAKGPLVHHDGSYGTFEPLLARAAAARSSSVAS